MMLNDRQSKILNLLSHRDLIPVNELSESLGVSTVTIRQDLNYLETEGLLKRVHGGAVFKDADDLSNRLGVNYGKKLRIARKAASFVKEGETILIESGSVNALLARELMRMKKVTIITTNVYIAVVCRNDKSIIYCGVYQHESESLIENRPVLIRSISTKLTALTDIRNSRFTCVICSGRNIKPHH
jgi:DeoR/GlpR family transcriptional regulator of sugar metabolism